MHCFVISSSPPYVKLYKKMKSVCCVVRALESILKTKSSLDKLKTITFEELRTVKLVMGQIKHEDGLSAIKELI